MSVPAGLGSKRSDKIIRRDRTSSGNDIWDICSGELRYRTCLFSNFILNVPWPLLPAERNNPSRYLLSDIPGRALKFQFPLRPQTATRFRKKRILPPATYAIKTARPVPRPWPRDISWTNPRIYSDAPWPKFRSARFIPIQPACTRPALLLRLAAFDDFQNPANFPPQCDKNFTRNFSHKYSAEHEITRAFFISPRRNPRHEFATLFGKIEIKILQMEAMGGGRVA